MKDIPKTWVLWGKQFEDFGQKKEQERYARPFKNTQWNTRTLKASIEQGVRKQYKLNWTVIVDEYQNTRVPNIHSLGDCCGKWELTPVDIAVRFLGLSFSTTCRDFARFIRSLLTSGRSSSPVSQSDTELDLIWPVKISRIESESLFLIAEGVLRPENTLSLSSCEVNFWSPCVSRPLSLGYWVGQCDEENTPLRDRDRLRSDPHEFPGFLN